MIFQFWAHFFTWLLKVQSCKLYNHKHMIALTQIASPEILALIAVLVFKFRVQVERRQ